MNFHPSTQTRKAEKKHLSVKETTELIKVIEYLHDKAGVKEGDLAKVCNLDPGAFSRKKHREPKCHFTPAEKAAIFAFAQTRFDELKPVVKRGLRMVSRGSCVSRLRRDATVLTCTATSNPCLETTTPTIRRKIVRAVEHCLRQMSSIQIPTVKLPNGYPAALLEAGHVELGTDTHGVLLKVPTVFVFVIDPSQLTADDPHHQAAAGKRLQAHEIEPVTRRLQGVTDALVIRMEEVRQSSEVDEKAAARRAPLAGPGFNANYGR